MPSYVRAIPVCDEAMAGRAAGDEEASHSSLLKNLSMDESNPDMFGNHAQHFASRRNLTELFSSRDLTEKFFFRAV